MKKQPEFNIDDIKKVCNAILKEPIRERFDETRCIFCYKYQYDDNKPEHENDCPVLIAKDLMTGLK